MGKEKTTAKVMAQEALTKEIFRLTVRTPLAREAKPGQFAGLYAPRADLLLPRPISVCDADAGEETLTFVYRIAGEGTQALSRLSLGDDLPLLGMLGNGFPLEEARTGERVALLGGGIGIPPLYFTAKELVKKGARVVAYLGYRDAETFLAEDFAAVADVCIATQDGSQGVHGTVTDALARGERPDLLYACGPLPMLAAIKRYGEQELSGTPVYLSLEERMACGVGACLGCVCRTTKTDDHSRVRNRRVCTEGPVFSAEEVEIG